MLDNLLYEVGNLNGHFSKKEHRAQKLIHQWADLEEKFEKMVERGGHTETSRLAYAVLVMMDTGIRVGNEGSAEGWICENQILAKKDYISKDGKEYKTGDVIYQHPLFGQHVSTYGVTTLLNKHVDYANGVITLSFTGKKLVGQELKLNRHILCRHLSRGNPDESWLNIDYGMLKKFVKRYVGGGYSPKDIRTATVNRSFVGLFDGKYKFKYMEAVKKSERKAILKECISETAEKIGHTVGVCRSAYLSPLLLGTILSYPE